jgi:hypothetical protein
MQGLVFVSSGQCGLHVVVIEGVIAPLLRSWLTATTVEWFSLSGHYPAVST